MKEFFFATGCVFEEGDNAIRVRVPANKGTTVHAFIKGDRYVGMFREDANLTVTAKDPYGKRTELPELEEYDSDYAPWLDVILEGPTSVELADRDGRKGLLVRIGGTLDIDDPDQSWPFPPAATSAFDEFHFCCNDPDDVGPHWPLSPEPKKSV